MKMRNIKLTALVLAALMLISGVLILTTAAQPSAYSTASNSGTRDEWCTTLDGTSVSSYYTGSYAYETLIELSPGSLKSSLHDLMTNTHKKITSYNDCRDYVWRVDCENNDTDHATTLYTSYSMTTADWSPAWACNREHVWPQSLGGGNTSGGGADLHHIRPAEAGVNSSRGNKPYGESTSKGFYEPADNVKGDVARIVLYVYVRWDAAWGATDVTEVFESVDILLAWCELDPVDTWEMGRNEVVQSIQGNRNAFIDYPELAWHLFGREVPEGMVTPSGSALNGEIPTPPADTETTPVPPVEDETDDPADSAGKLAEFDFGANGGGSHSDGTDITSSKSYTDGNYTLTLTSPTKLYGNARDAKGNSCLKLGSSKATGSFTFTVGDDVDEVTIYVAQYKANKTTVQVNGTQYTVNTSSNDGEYTPITIDTTATKKVTVATVSGAPRCMINTIEFRSNAAETEEPEVTTEEPEVTTEEPEVTTEEPEVTTEEPEVTTEEPEVTTEEPEVTTEEPEVTTEEPEVTTEEPEVTTEEPEVTTEEPEVTTEEPEVTTEEPEVTTEEPEVTTEEPEVTTEEPEVTTEEPEVTTEEPEVTTEVPVTTEPESKNDEIGDVQTNDETATPETTDTTPDETGCGSSFMGGAVVISMLCMGVLAVVRKKED